MLTRNEIMILAQLRQNSRQTLSSISRKTGVPVSTVYERVKQHEGTVIKKFTSILDFPALGFNIRAKVLVKGKKKELRKFLTTNKNINSVFEVSGNHNFIVDCIFKYMSEMKDFMEKLDELCKKKEVYFVTNEIKREAFPSEAYLKSSRG